MWKWNTVTFSMWKSILLYGIVQQLASVWNNCLFPLLVTLSKFLASLQGLNYGMKQFFKKLWNETSLQLIAFSYFIEYRGLISKLKVFLHLPPWIHLHLLIVLFWYILLSLLVSCYKSWVKLICIKSCRVSTSEWSAFSRVLAAHSAHHLFTYCSFMYIYMYMVVENTCVTKLCFMKWL